MQRLTNPVCVPPKVQPTATITQATAAAAATSMDIGETVPPPVTSSARRTNIQFLDPKYLHFLNPSSSQSGDVFMVEQSVQEPVSSPQGPQLPSLGSFEEQGPQVFQTQPQQHPP